MRARILAPLLIFLVSTFAFSAMLGWAQALLGIGADLISLVQFAPALGVLVVVVCFRHRGHWSFQVRLHPFRGLRPWPVAASAVCATAILVAAVSLGTDVPVSDLGAIGPPVAALLIAQFIGACGEELGWRCLLQPTLRARAGPVLAGAVTGAVWGLWHVQILTLGPLFVCGFMAGSIGMSIVLALLLDRARSPLLPAAVFHVVINIGLLIVGDEETGRPDFMLRFGLAALLIATVVFALHRSMRREGTDGIRPTGAT